MRCVLVPNSRADSMPGTPGHQRWGCDTATTNEAGRATSIASCDAASLCAPKLRPDLQRRRTAQPCPFSRRRSSVAQRSRHKVPPSVQVHLTLPFSGRAQVCPRARTRARSAPRWHFIHHGPLHRFVRCTRYRPYGHRATNDDRRTARADRSHFAFPIAVGARGRRRQDTCCPRTHLAQRNTRLHRSADRLCCATRR